MRKRIKITESQFDRLFTEDTDPILAFQDLEEGDVIYIKDASGSHSFQVIDDLGNALKLASMDIKSTKMGWYFIVSKTEGVQDEDIRMTQVSKNNPETKRSYTIKGVETVKITNRTGVEKDTIIVKQPATNTVKPATNAINRANDDTDTEENKAESIRDTIRSFNSLDPQTYHILVVDDETNIIIKVISLKNDDELKVELVGANGGDAKKYEEFKGKTFTIPLNTENFSVSAMGSGWFNMGLVGEDGVLNTISNISDFAPYKGDSTPKDDTEKKKKKGGDKYTLDAYIKKFPEIAKALSHQPKLFGLFNSGDPVGLGAVDNIVSKYEKKIKKKEAGKKFAQNRKVSFEVMNHEIILRLPDNTVKRFETNKVYKLPVINKSDKGVKLSNSKGAKNRYVVDILDKIEKDTYAAKFTYSSTEDSGLITNTSKNGTLKVINYNTP